MCIPIEQNLWIIVGAVFGALFGSKLLAWLESAPDYWPHRHDPAVWLGGKTIVGGLLGGWIGVEIAKKVQGIRHSTGDAFAFPLIFGMAVGRIGCFLTGLDDHTHGNPTSLPWGIDMGDGIRRHPTQLYDIVFLTLFATLLGFLGKSPLPNGRLFRLFLLGYRHVAILCGVHQAATYCMEDSARYKWPALTTQLLLSLIGLLREP